jgi:hypothetical protein
LFTQTWTCRCGMRQRLLGLRRGDRHLRAHA